MITCPNCGASVREGQRFCGNCGTDVQAAAQRSTQSGSASRAGYPPASSVRSQQAAPPDEEQSVPYAYNQPSGYDYDVEPARTAPPPGRMLIVGAAILAAILCAFACGLLFGFEIIPDLLGMGVGGGVTPTRVPGTPTPTGLMPFIHILFA